MEVQKPEKNYRWEAHYISGIDSGDIGGIGSIVRQRIKAKNQFQALEKILEELGRDQVDVVVVFTPFMRPVARYLSKEAATLEDCSDSNLSEGEFPLKYGHIALKENYILTDGMEIPYHKSRVEEMKETWVPI